MAQSLPDFMLPAPIAIHSEMRLIATTENTIMEFNQIAEEAIRANPALESLQIVIEDYLEDARAKKAPALNGSQPAAGADRAEDQEPRDLPILLLVGADENIRMVLKLVLHDVPHKLLWAQEQATLADALEKHVLDLVIAEAQVSKAGGFQLMQMVKSHPKSADIPVVLLSNESFLDCLYAAYAAIGDAERSAEQQEAGT
jgi:CheY-like chemotaxis protein